MIVDLVTLEKSPQAFSAVFAPDEIDLEGAAVKLESPVTINGSIEKHILRADVEGEISAAAVKTDCARCLSPIEKDLKIPFRVSYVEPENYSQGSEVELSEDDLDVSILENERIDIKELVREQILLDQSESVQCRADCQGLCAECGANRNLIDCNCKEKEIDPRWAALKNLK